MEEDELETGPEPLRIHPEAHPVQEILSHQRPIGVSNHHEMEWSQANQRSFENVGKPEEKWELGEGNEKPAENNESIDNYIKAKLKLANEGFSREQQARSKSTHHDKKKAAPLGQPEQRKGATSTSKEHNDQKNRKTKGKNSNWRSISPQNPKAKGENQANESNDELASSLKSLSQSGFALILRMSGLGVPTALSILKNTSKSSKSVENAIDALFGLVFGAYERLPMDYKEHENKDWAYLRGLIVPVLLAKVLENIKHHLEDSQNVRMNLDYVQKALRKFDEEKSGKKSNKEPNGFSSQNKHADNIAEFVRLALEFYESEQKKKKELNASEEAPESIQKRMEEEEPASPKFSSSLQESEQIEATPLSQMGSSFPSNANGFLVDSRNRPALELASEKVDLHTLSFGDRDNAFGTSFQRERNESQDSEKPRDSSGFVLPEILVKIPSSLSGNDKITKLENGKETFEENYQEEHEGNYEIDEEVERGRLIGQNGEEYEQEKGREPPPSLKSPSIEAKRKETKNKRKLGLPDMQKLPLQTKNQIQRLKLSAIESLSSSTIATLKQGFQKSPESLKELAESLVFLVAGQDHSIPFSLLSQESVPLKALSEVMSHPRLYEIIKRVPKQIMEGSVSLEAMDKSASKAKMISRTDLNRDPSHSSFSENKEKQPKRSSNKQEATNGRKSLSQNRQLRSIVRFIEICFQLFCLVFGENEEVRQLIQRHPPEKPRPRSFSQSRGSTPDRFQNKPRPKRTVASQSPSPQKPPKELQKPRNSSPSETRKPVRSPSTQKNSVTNAQRKPIAKASVNGLTKSPGKQSNPSPSRSVQKVLGSSLQRAKGKTPFENEIGNKPKENLTETGGFSLDGKTWAPLNQNQKRKPSLEPKRATQDEKLADYLRRKREVKLQNALYK